MAAKKSESESSPMKRRKSLNDDVEKFLAAGNKIEYIPDGVSAQDPQGRGKPLSSNTSQKTAPTAIAPTVDPKAAKEETEDKKTEKEETEDTKAEDTKAEDTKAEDAKVEDTTAEVKSADDKKDAAS